MPLYNWISSERWQIDVGLLIDQLSIVFVLLITGVGGLIHVYSIGYMAHDARRRRFFAFLNLFVAAMLLLVLADNYLVLFVGWEGVGLTSYLLIGFWQYKPVATTAAKKALWSTGLVTWAYPSPSCSCSLLSGRRRSWTSTKACPMWVPRRR